MYVPVVILALSQHLPQGHSQAIQCTFHYRIAGSLTSYSGKKFIMCYSVMMGNTSYLLTIFLLSLAIDDDMTTFYLDHYTVYSRTSLTRIQILVTVTPPKWISN